VKDVAAIHKRCVGDKAISQEAGKRDLGSFLNERTEVGQSRSDDCVPSRTMEVMLVGVDDHVASLARSNGEQCFCDGERRTAVGKANLDHHAWSLG
jgi:hypothetical protein